jgi:hypothetical protein
MSGLTAHGTQYEVTVAYTHEAAWACHTRSLPTDSQGSLCVFATLAESLLGQQETCLCQSFPPFLVRRAYHRYAPLFLMQTAQETFLKLTVMQDQVTDELISCILKPGFGQGQSASFLDYPATAEDQLSDRHSALLDLPP